MTNNSNYAEQFRQEVKSSLSSQQAPKASKKLTISTIVAIILGAIVLIESIFLIIVAANGFLSFDQGIPYEYDSDFPSESEDGEYHYYYSDEGDLTAFRIVCTASSGSQFAFTSDNQYTESDSSSSVISTGSYEILNDSLVSLSSPQSDISRVLYYDGNSVAENTTIYQCSEAVTNESQSEP